MKTRLLYKYSSCPLCNQGNLYLFKNLDKNSLYLHCEECEREFEDIEQLNYEHSNFSLDRDFQSTDATKMDIQESSWKDFHFVAVEVPD